jgi:hypothetical protein
MESNSETGETVLYKGDKTIKLTPNQSTVYVNDNLVTISSLTVIDDGKVMIPDSFISEILGIYHEVDDRGQILIVETNNVLEKVSKPTDAKEEQK